MEEKVKWSDVKRKASSLPFYNPQKRPLLKFGQYITVIESEKKELIELMAKFEMDSLELIEKLPFDKKTKEVLKSIFWE